MKKEQNKEGLINLQKTPMTNRELIAEKYRIAAERSKFIQEELRRVESFKQEIITRYNIK